VQPISLLFKGRIEHRDSLGNHRTVESGGMQWLVSGAGALHEEILGADENGIFHMAQLWVNLPKKLKMEPPQHHALPAADVPEFSQAGEGATIRLFAGDLHGRSGPAPMPTPVLVAHLRLEQGAQVNIPIPREWSAAYTVVEGSASSGGDVLTSGYTVVFQSDGDAISIASEGGGEVLVMAGERIDEPIARGYGFVMNTSEEIVEAISDYRSGAMGSLAPSR
jgi:quercetin 2,3-dioxygenase